VVETCGKRFWRWQASFYRGALEARSNMSHASKEDEAFFAAIGRLAISWAHIELGFDCAIDVIHRFMGGEKIDPDAPRTSLFRKTRYLRKWAKTVPEPTLRGAIPALMDAIEVAAETRHDLIHGVVIGHEEATGRADMVRLIHGATMRVEKKCYQVTTTQILRAAIEANTLATRSLTMGTGLQDFIATLADKPK
jgi:hypothetical protein